MAALLWQDLIFDLHRGGTRVFKLANETHDVENFAVTGVSIHQDRQAGRPVDAADEEADLLTCHDAEIRQSEHGRQCAPRKIERLEAGTFRNDPGIGVMCTRHAQDFGPLPQRRHLLAGRSQVLVFDKPCHQPVPFGRSTTPPQACAAA